MMRVLIWMGWGACVGIVAAIVITLGIVRIVRPEYFSEDNYLVAGALGAVVGLAVGTIGGLIARK